MSENVTKLLKKSEKCLINKGFHFKKRVTVKNKYSRDCVILGHYLSRIRRGYRQKHLAVALGVSRSIIADWEVGARLIAPELLRKVLIFFEVSEQRRSIIIAQWCKALISSGEHRQWIYANKYKLEKPLNVKDIKQKIFKIKV